MFSYVDIVAKNCESDRSLSRATTFLNYVIYLTVRVGRRSNGLFPRCSPTAQLSHVSYWQDDPFHPGVCSPVFARAWPGGELGTFGGPHGLRPVHGCELDLQILCMNPCIPDSFKGIIE